MIWYIGYSKTKEWTPTTPQPPLSIPPNILNPMPQGGGVGKNLDKRLSKLNTFDLSLVSSLILLYNLAETTEGTEGNQEEFKDAKEEAIDKEKAG